MFSSNSSFFNVFTYGTLMTGYHNHYLLEKYTPTEGKLRGYRRIWPKCKGFPVIERSLRDTVSGELYYIDNETKERIDRLEGAPSMYYAIQRLVKVENRLQVALVYYPASVLLVEWQDAEKDCGNYPDGLDPQRII